MKKALDLDNLFQIEDLQKFMTFRLIEDNPELLDGINARFREILQQNRLILEVTSNNSCCMGCIDNAQDQLDAWLNLRRYS